MPRLSSRKTINISIQTIINILPRQTAPMFLSASSPLITVTGYDNICRRPTVFAFGYRSVTQVGPSAYFLRQSRTRNPNSAFLLLPLCGRLLGDLPVLPQLLLKSRTPIVLSYFDTQTVVITVLAVSPINHAPKWANKTINEVGSPGNAINLTISKMCTDPDGDLLTFSLVTGISPSTSTITTSGDSSIYSFTPGPRRYGNVLSSGRCNRPLGLSDTMTITLKINAPNIVSKALTAFSFKPCGNWND